MKYIKTHAELLKLHGKRVICELGGMPFDDVKISVDGEDVYICQDFSDGIVAPNKMSYKYSYLISCKESRYEKSNRSCKRIKLKPDVYFYTKFDGKEYTIEEFIDFAEKVNLHKSLLKKQLK